MVNKNPPAFEKNRAFISFAIIMAFTALLVSFLKVPSLDSDMSPTPPN